ncbi:diaminopropionate ammonia-lyase [Ruegeria sp. SCP11]|uniref:diaminopropionate ammonia-lyase n=1 Tax=Ruegeria sp. SCP11 TaxID=3141378 RepID=UPI00333D4C4C
MLTPFTHAKIQHHTHAPKSGNAVNTELTAAAFDAAEKEITSWDGYSETPLVELNGIARQAGIGRLSYKDEGQRFHLRSFKVCGGAYAILRVLQRELSKKLGHGVNTADILAGKYNTYTAEFTFAASTDGNHGRSVAWGAARCGAQARIYIGNAVSEGRAEAMRALGAEVVRTEGEYAEAVARVRKEVKENGWFAVIDTASRGYEKIPGDILAGYGLIGREITQQLSAPPTHIFLQASVGGMASAVSSALVQHWGDRAPKIVVMETEHAPNLIASARKGEPVELPVEIESIMGGLSCGEVSTKAWSILSEIAQHFVTVPDDVVKPAMRLLASQEFGDPKVEAGETGVSGLCAVLTCAMQADLRDRLGLSEDSHVLVLGTEGVTDPEIYAAIINE